MACRRCPAPSRPAVRLLFRGARRARRYGALRSTEEQDSTKRRRRWEGLPKRWSAQRKAEVGAAGRGHRRRKPVDWGRPAGAGAAGTSPWRPDPQRPDPDRGTRRALGHGRVAVLDQGGGLVLVLRGRRPLRLGRRPLARCGEGRPLGGAGADPPRVAGVAGPHGRLRQGGRPGPELRARAQPPRDHRVARHRQQHGERLRAAGVSRPLPEGLDDAALEAALFPAPPLSRVRRLESRTGDAFNGSYIATRASRCSCCGSSTGRLIRTATSTAGSASATGRGGADLTWVCGRSTGRARRRSSTTRVRSSRSWTGALPGAAGCRLDDVARPDVRVLGGVPQLRDPRQRERRGPRGQALRAGSEPDVPRTRHALRNHRAAGTAPVTAGQGERSRLRCRTAGVGS